MDEQREKVIARVLALAEVTVENGATPSEAAVAESLAKKLIAKHSLTLDEVEGAARDEALRRGPAIFRRPPPVFPQQGFGFGSPTTTVSGAFGNGVGFEFTVRFGP